ncbi:hypothetical protein Micbo1qcDRAFT_202517 [Microdochium bolleyi]|uniref:Uncharacterized protein n=1 Tax=Microdochium bolleyi TaxID=196109 RepID=A0A136JBZ1_9PEZI|nr:hypothetical protein Micbo1qcDRAFT_202517 [Microdochium bolleyi]
MPPATPIRRYGDRRVGVAAGVFVGVLVSRPRVVRQAGMLGHYMKVAPRDGEDDTGLGVTDSAPAFVGQDPWDPNHDDDATRAGSLSIDWGSARILRTLCSPEVDGTGAALLLSITMEARDRPDAFIGSDYWHLDWHTPSGLRCTLHVASWRILRCRD